MENVTKFMVGALFASLMMISCQNEKITNDQIQSESAIAKEGDKNIIFGQYIVLFKESKISTALNQLDNASFKSRTSRANLMENFSKNSIRKINTILTNNNIEKSKVLKYYTAANSGLSVKLTDEEFDKLSRDESVESIEFDRRVELDDFMVENITKNSKFKQPAQEVPCGIEKAGGFSKANGKRTWIWIIDGGIDLDHPDLNVITNRRFAKSFFEDDPSPNDCSGHGTHVAGTAAAIDNDFGVVGVSAGAPVVPVKVISCTGKSSISIILSGIDHVAKFSLPGDVVNMSIGNRTPLGENCSKETTLKKAIKSLGRKGVFVSMATGNERMHAKLFEPGCINGKGIFTVAAMNCNEEFEIRYSNHIAFDGEAPIDFIAVGTSVKSTYLNGEYATMTGTSMAAPHVSGIIHATGKAPKIARYVVYENRYFTTNYPVAGRK